MTLAFVTVTYNSADVTARLLDALDGQTDRDFRLVVVDNASTAGERQRLTTHTDALSIPVEVVLNATNRGYSGGNNDGIRRALDAGAEWVVLLNNDTEVDPGFVHDLRTALAGHRGVVGLPLLEAGHVVRAGRRRWLATELAHDPLPGDGAGAYVVGAAAAIHRSVFARIGLLDERYFLYFEDVDFSERARQAGFPVEFVDGPVVRHAVSTSTRRLGSPRLARYHARNAILFNREHGPRRVRLLVGPWSTALVARQRLKIWLRRDRERSRAVIDGVRDARAGRFGAIQDTVELAIECSALEGPTWGVGRLVERLLRAIGDDPALAAGTHVTLYSNGPLPDTVEYDRRVFTNRPLRKRPGGSFVLYYFALLPWALRRDQPGAVFYPAYMLPPGAPGPSLVLLTDDVFREARNPDLPWRSRVLYRLFSLGWARARATKVMTLSTASARALATMHVDPERIVVNEAAVDGPRADVRPSTPSTFLWVGQAFPRRHLREALGAFATIARQEPATFRVIGPDRYPEPTVGELAARINGDLGRDAITWEAFVTDDELAAAYAGADAIVYVSATEAFGLPPLEALAYGTPAVLADTPVNREIYGPHAFYVPVPVTEDGIAATMEASRHDRENRARIAAAAPAITRRFGWHRYAERFLAAMRELASR